MLVAAGCGDDDDDGGGGSTNVAGGTTVAAATQTTGEAPTATAGPSIDDLAGKDAYETKPPTEGPAPAKGKKVWWISCGQQVPDCNEPASGAQAAAKELGLDFHIADGKLNVAGGNATALRTALAAKPDAVIIHGIACPVIRQALNEAKAQKVKVMGVEALDCSDPPTNGAKLFTADMNYAPKAPTTLEYFRAWGKITAQYMIASLAGKGKIINSQGTDPLMEAINDGWTEVIKTCKDCEGVDEFNFNSSDQIPNGPYVQRLKGAITKNPDADSVNMLFDANVVSAGGERAAHELNPELKLYGGSGQNEVTDLIRAGKVVAAPAAHSPEWMGWGAIDNINRVLQDQPTVPQGVGFRPVDKDHNMPASSGESYKSPVDFKAAYKELWSSS
jgi:ribose transport system substrate-binding protein